MIRLVEAEKKSPIKEAGTQLTFLSVQTTHTNERFTWDPFKGWVPTSIAEMQPVSPQLHTMKTSRPESGITFYYR